MTIIRNILLVIILFTVVSNDVLAGGDDGLNGDERSVADNLLQQAVPIKPLAEPNQSLDDNTAWLNEQRARAHTINRLKHEAEVAQLQEEIAAARKACLDTGHGCPLIDERHLVAPVVDTGSIYYPQIIGVHGDMVGISHEGGTYWLRPGETSLGVTVREISIDKVVFERPDGEVIHASVRQRESQ